MNVAVPARCGQTVLRRLEADDANVAALVDLYAGAYTVMEMTDAEKRERYETRMRAAIAQNDGVTIAAYRDGALAGVMKWYDYTMRLRTRNVFAGGLGAVAVALDARRRGVAGDLVRAFVEAYRAAGATIALLHPFRHDFYRRFGFGHGTKMNRYRIPPSELPDDAGALRVRQMGPDEAERLAACYERVRARTNGLIVTEAWEFREQLENRALRIFAYVAADGEVRGFLTTRPMLGKANNANANELRVFEPIAETPAAMRGLLGFLRGLADQFAYVILETQDDAFHIVPRDPRDESGRILHPPAYHETNAQGAGVMYRVLDVPRALEALAGGGARPTVWASLRVLDALIPENAEAFDVALSGDGAVDGVTASLDVADFSSLVVGALRFRTLFHYGLANVSAPEAVPALDRLFAADAPPLCTTHF